MAGSDSSRPESAFRSSMFKQPESAAPEAPASGVARVLAFVKTEWKNIWEISKAIVLDHEFFISSLAVKGGLTSLILGGIIGLSYVLTLPFVIAATVIAFNIGLVGLGLYGIYKGAVKAELKIRTVLASYYPALAPREHRDFWVTRTFRRLRRSLTDNRFLAMIRHSAPVRRFLASESWKRAQRIVGRQEKILLGGLATGGSIFSFLMGLLFLASQFVAVPLIAGGSLLTSLLLGLLYIATGILGGYFSLHSLKESIREWRQQRAIRVAQKKQRPPARGRTGSGQA